MGYEKLDVLVVEDNRTARRVLTAFLTRLGFQNILEAEDGGSALAILEAGHVDLVIADLQIPGPNGMQLLKWVRDHERTRDVPFLMLTAESQVHVIREAAMLGVNGYLIKPLSLSMLASKLSGVLSGEPKKGQT